MLNSGKCLDLGLPSTDGASRVMNVTLIMDLLEDELGGFSGHLSTAPEFQAIQKSVYFVSNDNFKLSLQQEIYNGCH